MKFLVLPNRTKENTVEYANDASDFLHTLGADVEIYDKVSEAYECGAMKECDAVIVLGGDGTILRVAQYTSKLDKPILGVNFGKIGYMADSETAEVSDLKRLITGDYSVDERMMIECRANDSDEVYYALNDFVIAHGSVSRMVSLTLSQGEELYTYSCDGIIAATPTGATAYSMAAGGAIIDPKLNCILITPICPHALGARQLVFSPECELKIKNENDSSKLVYLTVDGGENIQILPSKSVIIRRSERKTKLIRFTLDSFATTLSKKMKRRNL